MRRFDAKTSGPGVEATAVAVVGESLEPAEQLKDTEKAAEESRSPEEQTGEIKSQPAPKKPLSFWLAFAGLALVLFVFQLDATCLSIALPVSTLDKNPHHPPRYSVKTTRF